MFRWSWWKISTTFTCIHEDSNNAKDSHLGWSKSMVSRPNESVVLFCSFLRYTTFRQWERYPNRFQHLPAEALLSLSENLEMSGAANRWCWRRERKKNTNQLKSQYLICLRRWLDYRWPSWVGFHCRSRYNQHPFVLSTRSKRPVRQWKQ